MNPMIERYSLSPMKELWSLQAQYERWLQVELAALHAMEGLGEVPKGTFAVVKKTIRVDLPRIRDIEEEIRHDLLAFIRTLEEQAGEAGRFIHQGLTSSDVKDTALSLQMRDGLDLIVQEVERLRALLFEKAHQYQDLVIVGRTHGMHAEPTTLGLKFLLWHEELGRDLSRLCREALRPSRDVLVCHPCSGGDNLREPCASSGEDRKPSSTARSPCRGPRRNRNYRGEPGEDSPRDPPPLPHRPRPEGSSSMPHKRNPITSERICGLARILRGNLQAGLENIALWHERDMSHSSVERVILPDSFLLIHYMLVKVRGIIEGLVVHEERIAKNLSLTREAIYSQVLLVELIGRGMARSEAHDAIKGAAKDFSRRCAEG